MFHIKQRIQGIILLSKKDIVKAEEKLPIIRIIQIKRSLHVHRIEQKTLSIPLQITILLFKRTISIVLMLNRPEIDPILYLVIRANQPHVREVVTSLLKTDQMSHLPQEADQKMSDLADLIQPTAEIILPFDHVRQILLEIVDLEAVHDHVVGDKK